MIKKKNWMSNIKYVHCKPLDCMRQSIYCSWSIATMLCNIVVAIVGRKSLRSMLLAMLTMKKELHGFLFLCMHVVLFL